MTDRSHHSAPTAAERGPGNGARPPRPGGPDIDLPDIPEIDPDLLASTLFVGTNRYPGTVKVIGTDVATIELRAHGPFGTASIRAGAPSVPGELDLRDELDRTVLHGNGRTGVLAVGADEDGESPGDVRVRGALGHDAIRLDGANAFVTIGGIGNEGDLLVTDVDGSDAFRVHGESRAVIVGGETTAGDVRVHGALGRDAIRLDGENAFLTVGGVGNEGDLLVTDTNGFEAFRVHGSGGSVHIGGYNIDGDLTVHDLFGRDAMRLDGANAVLTIGSEGKEGDLVIRDAAGRNAVEINGETAEVKIGSAGLEGDLVVRDVAGVDRIRLNGATGDIELMGADLAEEFASAVALEAGTVVVAIGPDEVDAAREDADRRVVGVVSGAGDFRSALRLAARPGEDRVPIALVGRVHCKAVADEDPITFGDLLVTSAVEGHVRRAPDEPRAGTVLGKALGTLDSGRGMIPVLLMQR
jgi:hypothetical protein